MPGGCPVWALSQVRKKSTQMETAMQVYQNGLFVSPGAIALRIFRLLLASTLLLSGQAGAAEAGPGSDKDSALITGKSVHYSAWAEGGARSKDKMVGRDAYLGSDSASPKQAFFGDTHVHTSYSADAAFIGNTIGPDGAYRFAKGEEVVSSTGTPAKLSRPLDFIVVADHAENLGLGPLAIAGDPSLNGSEFGRFAIENMQAGNGPAVFDAWRKSRATVGDPMKGDTAPLQAGWKHIVDSAEQHNDPGVFTAFIGYEWTSVPQGNNLHRNVIFRGGRGGAEQVLPYTNYESDDAEDLWRWMADYEKKTGDQVLAIPHNGNLSNGLMFDDVSYTERKPLDKDYAERRQRWEPLYEVTQMKGDAEAHPSLSPNDEFADFETWDVGGINSIVPKSPDMLPREYARAALKRGLSYEAALGVNPFKFGLVGSTDTHTSISGTDEDNYFGKVTPLEPSNSRERFWEPVAGRRPAPDGTDLRVYAWQVSSSGLVGVWAEDNTRAELWDAMKRKEVFATTGTRIQVRVFAGFGLDAAALTRTDFPKTVVNRVVPMGGDLSLAAAGQVPGFYVQAMRDPMGANLDRVQMIKGWLDASGKQQERIYDIALADGRSIASDGRAGKAVGNTVDVATASYANTIGDTMLAVYWQDPDFDPGLKAFYYVRVLEIPTPRWTTIDARLFKREIPEGAPTSIQERAYTSPIWYTP
jgi:hypothetical protein